MPSIINITHGHFLIASGLVILVIVMMLAWRAVRRRRARGRPTRGNDRSNG
jgi:hypothetical protein